MHFYSLCTVLLLCAPALRAQPVPQAAPSKTAVIADDRLRAWLSSDQKVREKSLTWTSRTRSRTVPWTRRANDKSSWPVCRA